MDISNSNDNYYDSYYDSYYDNYVLFKIVSIDQLTTGVKIIGIFKTLDEATNKMNYMNDLYKKDGISINLHISKLTDFSIQSHSFIKANEEPSFKKQKISEN